MLDVEFAELSDIGPTRKNNEDYCGHFVPASREAAQHRGWAFAVADGVGGQEHGEVASRLAIEALFAGFSSVSSNESLTAVLPRLVQTANQRVYETSADLHHSAGMATTIVACALRFDRAVVSHVGDSRCYLIRRGEATALTRDHTVANEQLRLGILTARQAERANTANLLSRSLGTELFVNVDTSDHLLIAGDTLLLCSDGLHRSITPHEMAAAAGSKVEVRDAAQRLVALANARDGSDNASIQLIRVRSVESVGMYRGRPYKLPQ